MGYNFDIVTPQSNNAQPTASLVALLPAWLGKSTTAARIVIIVRVPEYAPNKIAAETVHLGKIWRDFNQCDECRVPDPES